MLKTLRESICAGILISIGGSVFLSCDNKYAGAIFFSVALLCICFKGYYLYTGKIGYIIADHRGKDFAFLAIGLAGNLIVTFAVGALLRYIIPAMGERAFDICTAKLEQNPFATFVRGFMCGILMYLAVSIYKEKNSSLGVLFCVPVFILSGFEHSIADMFYFGASGIYNLKTALFILMVVLGNTFGGIILPLLTLERNKNDEKKS